MTAAVTQQLPINRVGRHNCWQQQQLQQLQQQQRPRGPPPPLSAVVRTDAAVPLPASQQRAADIYHSTCALVGPPWEQLERYLGPLFPPQLALHAMLVLRCSSQQWGSPYSVFVFDFLPADPTSPTTAALLLSGQSVAGGCGH